MCWKVGSTPDSPGAVKFIHVSRAPADVVRSNVSMLQRMSMYNLQHGLSEDELRRVIADEYDRTERKFLAERAGVPEGSLAMMRYEDLIADPMAELKRVYDELGIEWTAQFETAAIRYLDSVRDYRSTAEKRRTAQSKESAAHTSAKPGAETAPPRVAWMIESFGHSHPARPKVETPRVGLAPEIMAKRARLAMWLLPIVAIVVGLLWLGTAILLDNRSDWLIWLAGTLIGLGSLKIARIGSIRLGVLAVVATLCVHVGVGFSTTRLIYYKNNPAPTWFDMHDATLKELRSDATLPWLIFALLAAYRLASRRSGGVPGK